MSPNTRQTVHTTLPKRVVSRHVKETEHVSTSFDMSNHGTTRHHTCGRGFTLTLHAHDLHWLPIHQRITYKLCTIVYKCLHGVAPSYLTEMSVPVAASTGRRCLRSAARGDLMVPRTRTITYGSRSFAVSGPRVWNDLPPTLSASSTTLGQFQSRLS